MANPFTPAEISQILEEFFKVVGTRQYVGARYVPIFGRKSEESIVWDNTKPYEPLTIVLYQGDSFTSRQYVPEGVDINNNEFWAETGNYNAQIEAYRQETREVADSLAEIEEAVGNIAYGVEKKSFEENTTPVYQQKGAVNNYIKGVAAPYRNIGVSACINTDAVPEVADGARLSLPNADVVSFYTSQRLEPYEYLVDKGSITYTANGANFDTTGMDIIVGSNVIAGTIDRYYDETAGVYRDWFASRTCVGTVTAVSENGITVENWLEAKSNENPTNFGGTRIPSNVDLYINPQNGIYGANIILRVPDDAPAGYKLYGIELNSHNKNKDIYSYGYAAVANSGRMRAAFRAHGSGVESVLEATNCDYIIKYWLTLDAANNGEEPTIFMSHGGLVRKRPVQSNFLTDNVGINLVTGAEQNMQLTEMKSGIEYTIAMTAGLLNIQIPTPASGRTLLTSCHDHRYSGGGVLTIHRSTQADNAHAIVKVIFIENIVSNTDELFVYSPMQNVTTTFVAS